jgi:hypothetical protein
MFFSSANPNGSFVIVPPQDSPIEAGVSLTITGQVTMQEDNGSGMYTKYTAFVVSRSSSVLYAFPLDGTVTQQWSFTFRYSEVYDLHARLAKKAFVSTLPLPVLPSRKLFGSSVSDDFVQQRSNSLQAYVHYSHPNAADNSNPTATDTSSPFARCLSSRWTLISATFSRSSRHWLIARHPSPERRRC